MNYAQGTIVTNYVHSHHPHLLCRRVYMDAICFGVSFHKWVNFSGEYCLRSWKELFEFIKKAGIAETFGMWFVKGDISVQQVGRRTSYFAPCMASHPGGDFNEHCLVVLSGRDIVTPTDDMCAYVVDRKLPCTVEVDPNWTHGGFLFQPDPNQLWQKVSDWVAPNKTSFKRVKSDPSIRGHIFAAGS